MSIPTAIRQQVWIQYNGEVFSKKCNIVWCQNKTSVFNFHVGHNIPRSKGGTIELENLLPICSNCNLSMSDKYTIDEWNIVGGDGLKISCCSLKMFISRKKHKEQT